MDPKLCALIVDDEDGARKLLKKLLEETSFFREIIEASSVNNANSVMLQFEPDLVFLDIKMPGKDGFSFINDLKLNNRNPEIVFVTAYEQFAVKALRNKAFDYLLKPVNRKDLKQCINRFIEYKSESVTSVSRINGVSKNDLIPRIRVNTRNGTIFINPSTIVYCKAEGNYTTICTGNKQHLCSLNIGKVHEMLPGNGFIRVGRSHIINFEFITLLDRKESSVTMVRDGETVTIKLPKHHLKDLDIK
jgi:two-component system, LytTR family, response regulator